LVSYVARGLSIAAVFPWFGACAARAIEAGAVEPAPPDARVAPATAAIVDASADASADVACAGPAPIFPVDAAAEASGKPARCYDVKRGGWGSSGGGCGHRLHYRCDNVRYSVECGGTYKGDATCVCKAGGRIVGEIVEPKKACGDTEGAREMCGFPDAR
jgi:hypothetical protein